MHILVVLYKFGTPEEIGAHLGSFNYFYKQLEVIAQTGQQVTVLAPWLSYIKRGSTNYKYFKVRRYWPPLMAKGLKTLLFYKLFNKLYIQKTKRLVLTLAPKFDLVYVRQARETGYAVALAREKRSFSFVFQPITTWRWHFNKTGKHEDTKNSYLAARRAKAQMRIYSKQHFNNFIHDTSNQLKYAQKILSTADKLITYNQAMADEYVGLGASQDKFSLVPGAIDHNLFKPLSDKKNLRSGLGWPPDEKIIVYIGRINIAEKGLDYLIEAVNKLRDQKFKLMIIGPATSRQKTQLIQLISASNLSEKINYLGPKPFEELPQLINAADLAVQPSVWFESFGRVSLDILACGIPLINTRVGGLSEMNLDGVTGLTVPPRDFQALAASMKKLLFDERLRKTLGHNARQRVLEHYTYEIVTKKFISTLKKLNQTS